MSPSLLGQCFDFPICIYSRSNFEVRTARPTIESTEFEPRLRETLVAMLRDIHTSLTVLTF